MSEYQSPVNSNAPSRSESAVANFSAGATATVSIRANGKLLAILVDNATGENITTFAFATSDGYTMGSKGSLTLATGSKHVTDVTSDNIYLLGTTTVTVTVASSTTGTATVHLVYN